MKRKFNNYVVIIVSLGLLIAAGERIYSANTSGHWIAAGEVKHIRVSYKDALGITSATIDGHDIKSRITKQYPDAIEIKLVASRTAKIGQRVLRLITNHREQSLPLYVFGLTQAQIKQSQLKQAVRLDVHLASPQARLSAYAHRQPGCLASTTGDSDQARPINNQPIAFKRYGRLASIWLTSSNSASRRCKITITESYPSLDAELSRDVVVELPS